MAVIGQQRPYSLDGSKYHVNPDGLRKAQKIVKLAARFKLPLVTFIDTQGADPGLEAEEHGIGNAIATTLSMMLEAPVPIVAAIIGEGGNEGALALGISDRIIMQQYAIFSPISLNRTPGGPYGDPELDREAAEALMLMARDCLELGIIDSIVSEPLEGAHNNPREAAATLKNEIYRRIREVSRLPGANCWENATRSFGRWVRPAPTPRKPWTGKWNCCCKSPPVPAAHLPLSPPKERGPRRRPRSPCRPMEVD